MNGFDTARIGFKLVGVYVLVQAIEALGNLMEISAYGEMEGFSTNQGMLYAARGVPVVLLLGLALALIWNSRWLSTLGVRGPEETAGGDRTDFYPALLSAVGALMVGLSLSALPRVVHNLAVALSADFPIEHSSNPDIVETTYVWAAGLALQLGVGIALLIRARPIAGWLLPALSRGGEPA